MKGYYFITDSFLSKNGVLDDVKLAVYSGVRIIQYRAKDKQGRELYEEASAMRRIIPEGMLIVNDRADIALSVGADGLHIGPNDIPYEAARSIMGKEKIIGVSVFSADEALFYEKAGADYIGAGPVFPTSTKKDAAEPIGIAGLKQIISAVRIPVVAIGGITIENAESVVGAGASCVSAISSVYSADNISDGVKKFMGLFR